jgi:hypothetical protein
MKRLLLSLIAAGGLAAAPIQTPDAPRAGEDAVRFAADLMVPMRDGVRLATDIYRPTRGGAPVDTKLPLLLHRTPYGKRGARLVEQARAFAAHGYVVAVQDERGAYTSEGVQTKYVGMGRDGYDTIEWLAGLPYVDGQVGMWGTSYAAHAQASAAILRPPHLKTIVLNMGGLYNGWHHKIRNHGAFELAQQVGWAWGQIAAQAKDPALKDKLAREKIEDWIGALRARPGLSPLAVAPNFEEYILELMTHADYDDYWKQGDLNWSEHFAETADIPMIHVSGWYDSYTAGAIANYAGLSKVKRAPMRLMVGPWTHGGNAQSHAGNVEFGPDAAIADFATLFHLRWFDHYLKGAPNGVDRESQVRLFVMGGGDGRRDRNGRMAQGGSWISAGAWPPSDTSRVAYYFHPDGTLRLAAPAEEYSPTTYTFDPRRPVPTVGGSFSSQAGLITAGAFDQRDDRALPLRLRDDVVVFQSEPLRDAVTVVGPVIVRLFASSTAVDTDFTAKLIDVHPPSADAPSGFEMNVTDGIVRGRYRGSPARQELMTPGTVYELTIEPFPTANVFQKGHRIRVDISSSSFPRWDVNPNTGEPLGRHRRMLVADNSIYHDRLHPSHVVLQVVAKQP